VPDLLEKGLAGFAPMVDSHPVSGIECLHPIFLENSRGAPCLLHALRFHLRGQAGRRHERTHGTNLKYGYQMPRLRRIFATV
jgi:hypothetical protein